MLHLKKNKIYVIAEIGHNHQGKLSQAKELFLQAKWAGADAVKLQKRYNKSLYTKKFYNEPYNSEHSFDKTYGKHRDFLEFNERQYKELILFAKKIKIDFFATAFDFASVNFLKRLQMPAYKIASADLKNIPLQTEIAKLKKPIFLSTGGGTYKDIERAKKNIFKYNKQLIILHCTAAYPVPICDMNLRVISELKKKYINLTIGLSDHENGIDAAPIAYMLGARVFEKHFTLDRSNKGSDHSFSLEPHGLKKMIRNLHRIDKMLGSSHKKMLESEVKPLIKMQKSIVTNKFLKKGSIISIKDIDYKSPGGGIEPYRYREILGRKLKINLEEEDVIKLKNLF